MPVPLTVVIPTLNEEGQIASALESLRWADEVIVADGGSSDRTVELARGGGAAVIEVRGKSIGAQRNAAIAQARDEWVLALDADHRATAWDLLGRPAWRFVRDYVVYGSWQDGRFGLVTSLLTACAGFLKYAYLWELERAESARRPR